MSSNLRQELWRATADGLRAYRQHRFRVRAVNSEGKGEWSEASAWRRTHSEASTGWPEEDRPTRGRAQAVCALDVAPELAWTGRQLNRYV